MYSRPWELNLWKLITEKQAAHWKTSYLLQEENKMQTLQNKSGQLQAKPSGWILATALEETSGACISTGMQTLNYAAIMLFEHHNSGDGTDKHPEDDVKWWHQLTLSFVTAP